SVTGVQTCALPIWTWSLGCMPRLRAGGGERTANSRNQGHRVAGAGWASEGRARIVLRLKSPNVSLTASFARGLRQSDAPLRFQGRSAGAQKIRPCRAREGSGRELPQPRYLESAVAIGVARTDRS